MVVASGDIRVPRFLRRAAGEEVDRLYRRHSGDVLRYAMLVLRSRTDAEDITQTVFLRALRAIERGEKVRTPRNWLIKITHNECRRLLATRKVHIELPDEIAVEPAETGRAEELRAAMEALPANQRQALVLRELEGRTYAEISQALELSESAVETLIFRARRSLREQIENAMSCEEFVELLDDPSARARVRAHARVCAECATLDHQSRGRKSALKRIASIFGLPGWGTWWGAKVAAVALTTATVAAVAGAVPHTANRPHIPAPAAKPAPSRPAPATAHPAQNLNPVPPSAHPKRVARAGGTRLKSVTPASRATPAAVTPSAPLPGPEQPAPTAPEPGLPPTESPQPAPLPSPTKVVPVAPPVAAPLPAVTVPQPALPPLPEAPTVTTPVVTTPAVSVPSVTVSAPESPLPTVTVPVATPKVSLP